MLCARLNTHVSAPPVPGKPVFKCPNTMNCR